MQLVKPKLSPTAAEQLAEHKRRVRKIANLVADLREAVIEEVDFYCSVQSNNIPGLRPAPSAFAGGLYSTDGRYDTANLDCFLHDVKDYIR